MESHVCINCRTLSLQKKMRILAFPYTLATFLSLKAKILFAMTNNMAHEWRNHFKVEKEHRFELQT